MNWPIAGVICLGLTAALFALACMPSMREGRRSADRKRAEEKAHPVTEVRYLITRPAIGWWDHHATVGEYMRAELEFGWRSDDVGPNHTPVTTAFVEPGTIYAWVERGPEVDRGTWPSPVPEGVGRRAIDLHGRRIGHAMRQTGGQS